jgi:hypothetical protein
MGVGSVRPSVGLVADVLIGNFSDQITGKRAPASRKRRSGRHPKFICSVSLAGKYLLTRGVDCFLCFLRLFVAGLLVSLPASRFSLLPL